MKPETKWGVVSGFSLLMPRMIDGDEFDTLAEAVKEAAEAIEAGETDSIDVVPCRYSPKHEVWVQVPGPTITLTANGEFGGES